MASTLLKNTFLSTYKDDFRDSDNYHRILFRSGRALQARELTQLQTIIQKEIQRLGNYLFIESSVISGNLGSAQLLNEAIFYAKLNTSVNTLPSDYVSLEGTYFTNANGLKGLIKKVIPAENSDPATLIYSIVDGADESRASNTAVTSNFTNGQDLTLDAGGTLTIQTINTAANPATGRASVIDVPQTETYTTGHFVFTPQQTLVIDKYNALPTDTIIYKVDEEIVTASDEQALYDNAGSTPNLTSPGADRYRVRLTLDLLSNINTATQTHIPLIKITNGAAEPLQFPDTILNRLGDLIAQRTSDINGNFIVRDQSNTSFALNVIEDSSGDHLIYQINPGVAFVDGYRVTRPVPTNIRVKKPRTDPDDIISVDGENVLIEYGNYYLADSGQIKGLVKKTDDLTTVNLYDGTNIASSSTVIGKGRIRNIEKITDNKYKIYMFDINIDSNGSGVLYNIEDTRSIGSDSANYANINLIENRAQLLQPTSNNMLFNLPFSRVHELRGDLNLSVKDVLTGTTDGAGSVTLNTAQSDEDFIDEDEWLLVYDSGGEILDTFNIASGGAGSTSVQINGLLPSQNVSLLCYVNTLGTITPKTKSSKSESLTPDGNNFVIPTESDFIKLTSVVDDTTLEDITYKYTVEKPFSSNFYQSAKLKIAGGFTPPSSTVTVTYEYFSRPSYGDFYGVNSYSISYDDIPTTPRSAGSEKLSDVLDFRSTKNYTGNTWDNIVRIPRNRDVVTVGTADYYAGRTDLIYIDTDGKVKVKLGVPGRPPAKPREVPGTMPIHYVILAPYTFDPSDLSNVRVVQKGYRMEDIRALENRVNNVEYLAALTATEISLNSLNVVDENGLERTKVGIFADGFSGKSKSLIRNSPDYRASFDTARRIIRPRVMKEHINLLYDSDLSTNTIRKGPTIWPKYSEEVYIDQSIASSEININQTQLTKFTGSTQLVPDADTWTERRVLDGDKTSVAIHGDLSSYETTTVDKYYSDEYGNQVTKDEAYRADFFRDLHTGSPKPHTVGEDGRYISGPGNGI